MTAPNLSFIGFEKVRTGPSVGLKGSDVLDHTLVPAERNLIPKLQLMKAGALLGFLFCGIFGSWAQQRNIDSLERAISAHQRVDTSLVNMRVELAGAKFFLTPTDSTWLDYNLETVRMAKELQFSKGTALAGEKVGIVYHYILSDPYKALEWYQKSLRLINTETALDRYAPSILGNIGNIYYEQQELRKALKYYQQVLVRKELNLTAQMNIGNIYGELGIADSSIHHYKKAISIAQKQGSFLHEANCLSNMALILQRQGQSGKALQEMEKSLELIERHQLDFVRSTAYSNAGVIYLANNDPEKAENYSLRALEEPASLNNLFTQKNSWGTLAEVYGKTGAYKKAFEAHQNFKRLNDSLTAQDRKVEISRREIQFEADRKEALAQLEIQRQKTIKMVSLWGGGALILAILGGALLYKRRRDALAQKTEAEFDAKVKNTALMALRAQMNPHFIFNSLNSIGDYINKNDKEAASEYLVKFAKLMRRILENSEKEEVSLQDDLEILETYLQVEAMRLDHKFDHTIVTDPDLDLENTLVPPLILQPFIENSIWHGISPKPGRGHINIHILKKGEMLICTVEDNGVGHSPATMGERRSLGMKITKSRIDIINQLKHTKGSVSVIPKTGGYRVEVALPLEYAF
ncbi:MAG: tetratricopeptide repeat protein [Sediminicola sp.]